MRPAGLDLLTILMGILNPTGLVFLDEQAPSSGAERITFLTVIGLSYVILWFFWRGRRWACVMVQLASLVAVLNLLGLGSATVIEGAVIVIEAIVGAYLLYWSRRPDVRSFFAAAKGVSAGPAGAD